MKKNELLDILKNYDWSYTNGKTLEEMYSEIYNRCMDYMNDNDDYSIEYAFNDFIDYDAAEEYAKHELENGGLVRLYYFLGSANCNNNLFRIDGYGNLEDITQEDIQFLVTDIIDTLETDGEI